MNLVACPKCGSRFDVSTLQPGSTFVCGSCKNVLQVPRQPVAGAPAAPARPTKPAGPAKPGRAAKPGRSAPPRRAAPKAPAKPQAGPQGGPRVDPRRAGGATSTNIPAVGGKPAKPAGRAARGGAGAASGGGGRGKPSRRSAAPADRTKKSALPLILGGVGLGVVAIIVVLVIVLTSGNDSGTPVAGGGNQGQPGNTEPNQPSAAEQVKAMKGLVFQAAERKDTSGLQVVHTQAKAKGLSGVARMAADAALNIDPNLDWANLEVGNKNLKEIFNKIPTDDILDTYENDAYVTLVLEKEEAEGESHWGSPAKAEELNKLLDAVLTHQNKLKNDRTYLDEFVIRQNVKHDPIYSNYEFRVQAKSPYIMFVEFLADEDGNQSAAQKKRAEGAAKIVERNLTLLHTLYTQFMSDYKEPFKLPEIRELEQPSMRMLKLWTFSSHESFMKYQESIGMRLPPGVGAYYRPNNQWITLFEQPGSASAGKANQSDFNTNKVVHEGFHQLMHTFTKVMLEREEGKEVLWEDPRTHSRLHWFQEGMAELYGSAKSGEGGKWDLKVPYHMRLGEWFNTKKNKQSDWTFEELMAIRTGPELQRRSAIKGLQRGQGRLSSLFYAQAWSWCYFLYNYENGKYRDKLIEYMGKELKGISGPEEWNKTWGAGENYDWGPVEKEWRDYVDTLFKAQGFN